MDRLSALVRGLAPRIRVHHAGPLARSAEVDAGGADHLDVQLVTAGEVLLRCQGESRTVSGPALILVRGGIEHGLAPGRSMPRLFCIRVEFDGPASPMLLGHLGVPLLVPLEQAKADLRRVVELIGAEISEPRCAHAMLLDHAGEILLIALLRHLVAIRMLPQGILAGLGDPGLARLLVALHEGPEQHWTLERMAEVAGMSRTVFAQRFRQVMGITPKRYLGDFRLMLARREVVAGGGLKRAARVAGYESTAALSRALSRAREPLVQGA
jgi:AraC-like DNA-binding protein